MTATRSAGPSNQMVTVQAAAVALGAAVLIVRPVVGTRLGWTTITVVLLFSALLLVGVMVPVRVPALSGGGGPVAGGVSLGSGVRRRAVPAWVPVLVLGVGVFVVARLAGAGHRPGPFTLRIVALNSLAAIAEEALFRRLAYGALLAGGAAWAVGGSALLFGLVHVTVYGWWALPIDLAAGLLLSWQRLASGTWAVPAVTHIVADLLVVM
jgi:hypothetical protein